MEKRKSRLVVFLIVFVDLLGFGIMIPMLPFYARSFGASAFEVGLLMFSYSAVQVFMAPVWGYLSDIYGRRPILLLTIFGQSFAFLIAGLAPTYFVLLASRSLAGIFAGNISTASAFMADLTPPEERAKGMGLIGAAFGLGFVFGPAIGGLLIPIGYEWPSLVAAMISFLNFLWAFWVLEEASRAREEREKNRRKFSLKDVSLIFHRPTILVPILLFFLLTFSFTQVEICLGLFVFDRFYFSERQAGLLLGGVGFIMALVQGLGIGPLVRRWGESRLIFIGEILLAISVFVLGLSGRESFLYLALLGMAVGYSITNPCLNAVASKASSSSEQGRVLGLYQSFGGLARVLGPLLAGWAYDQGRSIPFFISAGVVGFSAFFWVWHIKKHPNV